MSTSQSGPAEEGKQEGLSKYINRMRTVLRGSSTKSSPPVSSVKEAAPKSESLKPPAPEPVVVSKIPAPTVFSHWGAIQEEKARMLFAKYGLTLEPGEWKSPSDVTVQRVTKPIRMRVRRTCHRCETTFGPDKVCVNCQHVRCKACPRHPPTKAKGEKDHAEAALQTILVRKAPPPGTKDSATQSKLKESRLTMPSRTGGQDVVRRPITQRVRRTCHRCNALFAPNATECNNCRHIRCKNCPRDPPKLHKYPDGYPGDSEPPVEQSVEPPARTWKRPRQRVRYTCHICSNLYRSGEKLCSNCGQEKGPKTIRDPPKKQKPDPDPEIVKRVEERLAKVRVSFG